MDDVFVTAPPPCGGPIASPLLAVDPVTRHTYEHLEYKPLVNARAHALGKRRQVVNDKFHEQYHRFLKTLTYSNQLNDADLLAVTYYLLRTGNFPFPMPPAVIPRSFARPAPDLSMLEREERTVLTRALSPVPIHSSPSDVN